MEEKKGHIGLRTLSDISKHLAKARKKHPFFANSRYRVVSIATEELGEFAQAINDNKPIEEIKSEALDVIAVLVRFLEGD